MSAPRAVWVVETRLKATWMPTYPAAAYTYKWQARHAVEARQWSIGSINFRVRKYIPAPESRKKGRAR